MLHISYIIWPIHISSTPQACIIHTPIFVTERILVSFYWNNVENWCSTKRIEWNQSLTALTWFISILLINWSCLISKNQPLLFLKCKHFTSNMYHYDLWKQIVSRCLILMNIDQISTDLSFTQSNWIIRGRIWL